MAPSRGAIASTASHRAPAPVAGLAEDEADGVEAVGEVVADDRDEDEEPGRRVESEGEPDPEPVDEAVDREPEGAEDPDARVCARLLGLVAMVQHERALGEEEAEEAAPTTAVTRRACRPDRCFREHVEERDRDDDAAGERDHGRQLLAKAERDDAAEHRRDRGRDRERDCEPRHRATLDG